MAEHGWTAELVTWISQLAAPLDTRLRWRLAPLLWGVLWAKGRRTVSRWIAAAGLSDDWQRYYFLEPVGRKTKQISQRLLWLLIKQLPLEGGPFVRLALDDTPTPRYSPHVEGAGLHHDPTPGPSDAKLLYGHVWVALAWLAKHPRWGMIGLPTRDGIEIRKHCIGRPSNHQQILLDKLRLKLPAKIKQIEMQWKLSWPSHYGAGSYVECWRRWVNPFLVCGRPVSVTTAKPGVSLAGIDTSLASSTTRLLAMRYPQ